MKILVYGAGNIGRLYAALLAEAGEAVSILARGRHLAELHERGIRLVDVAGKRTTVQLPVVERLDPEDAYDLVLVILPRHRVPQVLPILAAGRATPSVMFFCNDAAGPGDMVAALGRERVLLGFPGAAGYPKGDRIRYLICSPREQPTTIGELDGHETPRILEAAAALKRAGFPVAICPRMEAWLKTHAAEMVPTVMALYSVGGDRLRLAQNRDSLLLMVQAIREGYRVLKSLDVPLTPGSRRLFEWIPKPLLVAIMRKALTSDEMAIKVGHAEGAREEWHLVADQLQALAAEARVATPATDRLRRWLDPAADPMAG